MLSKGFRDEENEKAGQVLTGLLDENFEPNLWRKQQREKVSKILEELSGITISELYDISPDVLLLKLKEKEFTAYQYEQLGDLLFNIAKVEPEHHQVLAKNSVQLYEYSQVESNTYSFSLAEKINQTKTDS